MATVSKAIADRVINGEFAAEDGWPVRIVKYTNQWGGESYGIEQNEWELGKYQASPFVINPEVYWERK
jgi:hypothetical protein